MNEQGTTLCYNCFKEKPQEGVTCPFCGFDLGENAGKYPAALRAGTVLKGRYLIGRVLGQGGFGITYLAWDQSLEAKVAVKEYMPGEMAVRVEGMMLQPRSAARQEDFAYGQQRFREEARILAKFMGQPGIAGVTDYFDENGTSYFVMDYIEGISFKTYIAGAGGKVSPEESLNVMIPVLRALTSVHAEGLIHRDVTPDNIYITKDGNVKLLDFGSARYSLGDKSKSLDVILKVGYAPKEQYIRRGRQGPYTDVYSCAACLYAAITGYLPPESLERLDHDTLTPPSQAGEEIPLYLERAILKGFAVQPEDRFQTAGEFLEALEHQEVVELTGGKAGQGEDSQKDASRRDTGHGTFLPALKKKYIGLLLAGGCLVIAVGAAAAFFAGVGKPGTSESGPAGNRTAPVQEAGASVAPSQETLSLQEQRKIEEAAAPKVTICGESYSTALGELELENVDLREADLEALAQMTNLERLEIVDSPVSQLDFLKSLTKLKRLHIRGNREAAGIFSDLSALAGLTQMEDLYLYLDGIADLSGLSGMSQLKSLVLTGNMDITDLSPLAGLTELRELDLTYGGYSSSDSQEYDSLVPLASLSNLTSLTIRNLKISDLSPLAGLSKLRSLTIHNGASIQDLSPLAGLPNLKSLTISGARHGLDTSALTQVSNISIESR